MGYIQFDTNLFTDVWESYDAFKSDYNEFMPLLAGDGQLLTEQRIKTAYYMLYAKYGNSPIANTDVFQWKMKFLTALYSHGPVWSKKLDIQEALRELDLTSGELFEGNKSIFNHALNPATEPSTGDLEELNYIDSQNTSLSKKGKVEGLSQLWLMLRTDVNEDFVNKFKKLFNIFVKPENPTIYFSED